MRQLDPGGGIAPYLDIANAIRSAIQDGEFEPGQRLPGRDALAAHFGVAPMTVTAAIRILRDEGTVISRQGQGVTVRVVPRPARDLAAEVDELRARVARLERERGQTR